MLLLKKVLQDCAEHRVRPPSVELHGDGATVKGVVNKAAIVLYYFKYIKIYQSKSTVNIFCPDLGSSG